MSLLGEVTIIHTPFVEFASLMVEESRAFASDALCAVHGHPRVARGQLHQAQAEGEHVAFHSMVLAFKSLGRHVVHGSEKGEGVHPWPFKNAGRAEVTQLDFSTSVD